MFDFEVRIWRILDWPRLNLPVPVFLKRLAAPECVFNFGMVFLTKKLLFTTAVRIADFRRFTKKNTVSGMERDGEGTAFCGGVYGEFTVVFTVTVGRL